MMCLTACSGLPKLSVTPVDAEVTVGGQHETKQAEDNMVKVQTGDTSSNEYTTDTLHQITNMQQEYPAWIIWGFAMAVGLALPSPVNAYSNWRTRRRLEKEIDLLRAQLYPQGDSNG